MDCSRVCRHETDNNRWSSGSLLEEVKGTEKHVFKEGCLQCFDAVGLAAGGASGL